MIFDGMGEMTEEKSRIGSAVARFMLIGIDGLILQNFSLYRDGDTNEGRRDPGDRDARPAAPPAIRSRDHGGLNTPPVPC